MRTRTKGQFQTCWSWVRACRAGNMQGISGTYVLELSTENHGPCTPCASCRSNEKKIRKGHAHAWRSSACHKTQQNNAKRARRSGDPESGDLHDERASMVSRTVSPTQKDRTPILRSQHATIKPTSFACNLRPMTAA